MKVESEVMLKSLSTSQQPEPKRKVEGQDVVESGSIRNSVTTRPAAYHLILFPSNMWMTVYQGHQEENFCPGNLHCSPFQLFYKVTQFFYTLTPIPKLHKNLAKEENCRPISLMNIVSKILTNRI